MTGEDSRRRRAACGLTQEQLGDRAGVSGRTIRRFEAGENIPLPVVMAQIERVLDEAEAALQGRSA